jgi:hypothetical protein
MNRFQISRHHVINQTALQRQSHSLRSINLAISRWWIDMLQNGGMKIKIDFNLKRI